MIAVTAHISRSGISPVRILTVFAVFIPQFFRSANICLYRIKSECRAQAVGENNLVKTSTLFAMVGGEMTSFKKFYERVFQYPVLIFTM